MSIDIGDLVVCRAKSLKVGVVIDKRLSNDGLSRSMHAQHLLQNYPKVYYVYFPDEGRIGPIHESDLSLQQSRETQHRYVQLERGIDP